MQTKLNEDLRSAFCNQDCSCFHKDTQVRKASQSAQYLRFLHNCPRPFCQRPLPDFSLKEAKNYLRVDYEEDDSLIQNLLSTAKNLVMDVGRMNESALAENEDTVRTAMLFALGYLYENRSNPDYQKLTLNLRSILFAQREGVM